MIASAPAWATWLALGLWGAALVAAAAATVLARRLWRERLRPMVEPLLSMLLPPSSDDADDA